MAPSAGDELILYQALLGSWPLELHSDDTQALQDYAQRVWQWQQKAMREAKLQSSWSAPNEAYEQATHAFLERVLLSPKGFELRSAIGNAVQAIAPAGALNGLAQTLLRLTVPGVPDLYQGNEFWDFSLVDPDNRRPVDFNARQLALKAPCEVTELLLNWHEGRVKQALIARVLARRAEHPELFRRGRYQALEVLGSQAEHVLAFMREIGSQRAVVIVPRLVANLLKTGAQPLVYAPDWGDTRVKMPFTASGQNLKGLFSACAVTHHNELMISAALGDFPVNLFIQT
jgi:(1->4)-alpha-D-glucan 1-alpha-D-glucosylmutase